MSCERLCVVCRHFRISGHREDYSELTPGERAELRCEEMLWPHPFWERDNGDGYMMNIDTGCFRMLIRTAETCASFDPDDGTPRP